MFQVLLSKLYTFSIIRHDLVGVKAPVNRTEDDFDPGAMFHIVGDYSFMRYSRPVYA